MNDNKKIQFFPGLNGLRFFAALSVIVCHVELVKMILGCNTKYALFDRLNFGGFGVYFFFVLSGFLITYLLLKEKDKTNSISLKKFYMRRILRIWPLYYLTVILGFFILPQVHYIDLPFYMYTLVRDFTPDLILYLAILPNLAFAIYPAVPHIGQSWSIGVEEQFYIFWPLLIRKARNSGKLIIVSFVVVCALKASVFAASVLYTDLRWLLYLKKYLAMCKFESMMIGAMGAYVLFENKTKILAFIYKPVVFYSSLLLFFPLNYVVFNNVLQNGIHIPISVMFLVIILNISTNPLCAVKLKSRMLDYLGQISYGIYMYHLMVIPFVIVTFMNYFHYNGTGLLSNIAIYALSILLTIVIAGLSFRFFEKPFLRIKTRFEVHP